MRPKHQGYTANFSRAIVLLGWSLACISQARGQASETEIEAELVANLVDEVDESIRSDRFEPVASELVAMRAAWLRRTLDRVEEYAAERLDTSEADRWTRGLELSSLQAELAKSTPDLDRLSQIYDEVSYWLGDAVTQAEFMSGEIDPRELEAHIADSMMCALGRYVELLRNQQDPVSAQQLHADRLKSLKEYLVKYDPRADRASRLESIYQVHTLLEELERSDRNAPLIARLRSTYLRPVLRKFVSTKTLNLLAAAIPLDPQHISDCNQGTFVSGVATPLGRPRLTPRASDRVAIIDAVYEGPVQFCGTARRSKIKLGISARLHVDLHKRFFLIQGLPDSGSARSQARLIATGTSAGPLIDRIVDRAVRRNFDGDQIAAVVNDNLDDMVTEAANRMNLGLVGRLRGELVKRRFTHMQLYRSRPSGVELTLLVAQARIREAGPGELVDPPDFLTRSDPDADVAISVRRGVLFNILSLLIENPGQANRLADVRSRLGSFFGLEVGPSRVDQTPLQIRFPENVPLATIQPAAGTASVNFRIINAEGLESPGQVNVQYRIAEGQVQVRLRLDVPGDRNLEQQLREQFRPLSGWLTLPIPSVEIGNRTITLNDFGSLRLDANSHYLTLAGKLNLPVSAMEP